MSRTRRIYNSDNWRKKAENTKRLVCIDHRDGEGIWTSFSFVYHPYAQLCMGNCKSCGRWRIRARKSRRLELRKEERQIRKQYIL